MIQGGEEGVLADVPAFGDERGDEAFVVAELEEEFETLRISKYGVAYITYLSPRGRKD